MRILILGVSGMFGNAAFSVFSSDGAFETWGTLRTGASRRFFSPEAQARLIEGIDVSDQDSLIGVLARVRPHVVINAVGVVKQLRTANDPLTVLPINAMLPHRLAALCTFRGARLVHISTDCVFSGATGNYREADPSDAQDLYGKSKYIGEVLDSASAITLRTSGIGHELASSHGLLEWFLSQTGPVRGYRGAIYTGMPWPELSRVIKDVVVPRPELHGLYHVSSRAISKFDLLGLIATEYGRANVIEPDDTVHIDRSLDSSRFTQATGYVAPEWPDLIASMHQHHLHVGGRHV